MSGETVRAREGRLRAAARTCVWPVLAALWLAAGCGLAGFDFQEEVRNRCSSDDSCGAGGVCNREIGACVVPTAVPGTVHLRFTYAAGAAGLQIVRSHSLEDLDADFDLPGPATVAGWVAVEPDGSGASRVPVAARVTFLRASEIPGESSVRMVATAVEPLDPVANWTVLSTFSVSLVPGRYTVYVEPSGDPAASVPPVTIEEFEVAGAGRRLEILLPSSVRSRVLAGLVTRSDGEPVPNLSVRADDPVSARRISTVATTAAYSPLGGGGPAGDPDAPAGWFEIRLPPGTERFRLVVTPTDEAQIFPTLELGDMAFAAFDGDDDGWIRFDGIEAPTVALPPIGLPVVFEATVEGTEPGAETAHPVTGATLRFEQRIETGRDGWTARFSSLAVTDTAGRIVPADGDTTLGGEGVPLLEGDYAVTITPSPGQGLAGLFVPSLLVAAPPTGERIQRGHLFGLGPRAPVEGRVRDRDGRPAVAVAIETRLVEAEGRGTGADPADLNPANDTATDEDGAFALWVEPGRHVVLVRPDAATLYPWTVLDDVPAPDGLLEVSLETPVMLTGRASIAGAAPGAALTVEAFIERAGGGRSVPVGKARTESDGSFRLLLSPGLHAP
jgi:hypothetical protein